MIAAGEFSQDCHAISRSVVIHQTNNIEGVADSAHIEDAIERGTRRALDEDARRQETLVRDAFVDE